MGKNPHCVFGLFEFCDYQGSVLVLAKFVKRVLVLFGSLKNTGACHV